MRKVGTLPGLADEVSHTVARTNDGELASGSHEDAVQRLSGVHPREGERGMQTVGRVGAMGWEVTR